MAYCKYCGAEISWLKEKRKFIPIERDGGVHECEEFKKSLKKTKSMSANDLTPEEIARYESNINKKVKK
tara:strand:- start:83 stop:289 length:207 start_codon:yes stop_codon:yes gene_type:complete